MCSATKEAYAIVLVTGTFKIKDKTHQLIETILFGAQGRLANYTAVASWLVRSSAERVVRVRALAGDIVRWTSILSSGSRNTPSRFMLQKPGISSGSYGPLGSKGFIPGE